MVEQQALLLITGHRGHSCPCAPAPAGPAHPVAAAGRQQAVARAAGGTALKTYIPAAVSTGVSQGT